MASNRQIHSNPYPDAVKWQKRRDIPLAILAWTALVIILGWLAGHVGRTILLIILAALLAFAIAPLARLFTHVMPRWLAITLTYVVFFASIGLLLYFVARTAIDQVISLAQYISYLLTPGSSGKATPLQHFLLSFGLTSAQITTARNQLVSRAESMASSAVPLISGIFNTGLDIIVVAVLSIYLVIDGPRMGRWLRHNSPRLTRADFAVSAAQRVIGGYIRGQVLLSTLIGVLVGATAFFFHVPYALLLGVLAFFLEFIPFIGTFISGLISVLLALTQGIPTAIGVLLCFVGIHIIEGDVVGPRIVGKAVGLHPAISLIAVIGGAELFGIWGALLASPIAGVLQVLVVTLWKEWRQSHPEQFSHSGDTSSDVEEEASRAKEVEDEMDSADGRAKESK